MASNHDPLDPMLAPPAFGGSEPDRRGRLLEALNAAYARHVTECPAYRRYCQRRGFGPGRVFDSVEAFPFLPVQAFKESAGLLCSVPQSEVKTRLYSSATTGKPSEIVIDQRTARRQVRALATVMQAVLGERRRPFLVMDADPRQVTPGVLRARTAAVRGFLNAARDVRYGLVANAQGGLDLGFEDLESAARAFGESGEPPVVFGFTFVLFKHVLEPFRAAGRRLDMPRGTSVVHIGGWKKLAAERISPAAFKQAVAGTFGVDPARITDFYGFTEQLGVVYPEDGDGNKVCPAFAEVVVRDPATLEPLPDGAAGLLEFLTPLPHSYPGLAVLTDDLGRIVGRGVGPGGWNGTRFQVLGRAANTEPRGCGDILGEKLAVVAARSASGTNVVPTEAAVTAGSTTAAFPRLLFSTGGNEVGGALDVAVDEGALPKVDLGVLAGRLRDARPILDRYSVDEIIALLAAAAQRWATDPELVPLKTQGLAFLATWCSAGNLRRIADASLRGRRGYLDGFQAVGGQWRTALAARSRGLVVHWLAGNVPALAMLVLAQSIVARNANLLKASRRSARVLPRLLDAFRGLVVTTAAGKVLRGDDLLETMAVVYCDRDDRVAAAALSGAADVRLAWGGAEAVRAIVNLPKHPGTEDVVFGPRLSFMIVGRESLVTPRQLRRLVRGAAVDASVFDQYACASPHTVFVETGAAGASPRDFAEHLAAEMARVRVRIPVGPVPPEESARIAQLRLRRELEGCEVWQPADAGWTVFYDEVFPGLAAPAYARTLTVKPIADVLDAVPFVTPEIQTIGLALAGPRRLAFAREAAQRGADRFPEIGRMTHFETPWDGLFVMDRLVRWIALGGPL
jgi:hypothetical protein